MMEITAFQQKIADLLPDIVCKNFEPMSKHTSFRVGGPAQVMLFPKCKQELKKILELSALLDCKPVILGAGTNVLAPDCGMEGMVICLKDCFDGMEQIDDTHICVSAGVTMSRAAVFAAGLGLSGLEFAHGIPGTVGGGVYMNAGAYGGQISDVCVCVELMYLDGSTQTIPGCDMNFSYRHSRAEDDGSIIISATFALEKKPETEIRELMQELMRRRKASQPLELPSAGSAFKRPVGGFAAALIDQAGLKGYQIGGAAVSEKHAGFVVNLGDATSADVKALLKSVAERVYDHSGVLLEPEIRIW